MDSSKKVPIDNLLSSSFRGLKQADFFNLLGVLDAIQTKRTIFCEKETYETFKREIKRQAKKLSSRELTYKEFKDNLVWYLAKIITDKYCNNVIILARDASFYKNENELYQRAVKIFDLIEKSNY